MKEQKLTCQLIGLYKEFWRIFGFTLSLRSSDVFINLEFHYHLSMVTFSVSQHHNLTWILKLGIRKVVTPQTGDEIFCHPKFLSALIFCLILTQLNPMGNWGRQYCHPCHPLSPLSPLSPRLGWVLGFVTPGLSPLALSALIFPWGFTVEKWGDKVLAERFHGETDFNAGVTASF